jgi:hypothetical protein
MVKIMSKGNNLISNIPDSSVQVWSNIQIIIHSSNKQIIVILELSKLGSVQVRVIYITENWWQVGSLWLPTCHEKLPISSVNYITLQHLAQEWQQISANYMPLKWNKNMSWQYNNSNKWKSHSQRREEIIHWECLLPFSSESSLWKPK